MRAMVLSELGPVENNPLKLMEIDKHKLIDEQTEILI